MKLQYFNGGLGNQLFQYIFYRYFQLHSPEDIWLDDMKFYKVQEHNGYELEKIFGVTPDLISKYFDPDVWTYMVDTAVNGGRDLCQQLKDMGEEIVMVAENEHYRFDGKVHRIPANGFYPEIIQLPGNVYYYGYWIGKEWFEAIRPVLMEELQFPALTGEENLQYAHTIETERTVGIHVRRGDFVKLNWDLPPDYYYTAMKNMSQAIENASYFVFSDDIGWCKEHRQELGLDFAAGNLEYVTCNTGEKSYVDMQLMSRCEGMIISNSAFSYFGALYNSRPEKRVINPLKFREV